MLRTLSTKFARKLLLAFALIQLGEFHAQALYQPGQIITNNFYFVARRPFTRPDGTAVPTGARVYLNDFAGRVVFLEWFAVWCPYCVAAAPQVKTGIVDWYAARGGNPYGVPVLHIAVNQESSAAYRASTDNFITQNGFNPVVNDYDGASINPVRFQFITSGQPLFVVINGVTNSPTHQPWQVLVNNLGYGQTDFSQTLVKFRSVIDTVQPPSVLPAPAQLSAPHWVGTTFEFMLGAQSNRIYRVEASDNLKNWSTLRSVTGAAGPVLFRETNAPLNGRFYRVVTP